MLNFNGNYLHLDAIMNDIRNPRESNRLEYAQKRVNRFEKALASRPVYIPLSFTLPASGSNSTTDLDTPLLPFDVTITGAITDAKIDRKLNITLASSKDNPFMIVGKNRNLRMRISDFAGGSMNAVNGQKGIFYFPAPIRIVKNSRIGFSIYKADDTDNPENLNIILVGYRTLQTSDNTDQRKEIERFLNLRSQSRTLYIKQTINFDSAVVGGQAKYVYFPEFEEPLIIKGCRSSMQNSLITNIKLQGEDDWNTGDLPVWAIAADFQNTSDSYIWFQRPVILPAERILETSFRNSIDGVNIDEQVNELTWLVETV